MGQPIYWGDRKLSGEWTDGEWERLQKIKRGVYIQNNQPEPTALVATHVSPTLKKAISNYSKEKGLTVSELLRNVLYILTS